MDGVQSTTAESRPDRGPVVFLSLRRECQIPSDPVRIGSTYVQPVSSVRDLKVYIDADMSMRTHVTAVVRS